MNVNYEYYRVFYYVAKYRNLTRELGCTLFIRSNRGVKLTPEGEKLYGHVRIAVEQIEMGEELLSMDQKLESGVISIGASEVALRCFLLPVLNEYHRRYPGVRLRISNQPTPLPIVSLRNGSVDIAVVTTPIGDMKLLHAQNLKEYREVAVCGAAFAELSERTVSLKELSGVSIISLGVQASVHSFYSEWFAQNGARFAPDIEVATADQILPLVRNNLGIGFVPEEFLKDEEGGNIFRLKLWEELPKRSVCCVKRKGHLLGMAAREFERMMVEAAGKSAG